MELLSLKSFSPKANTEGKPVRHPERLGWGLGHPKAGTGMGTLLRELSESRKRGTSFILAQLHLPLLGTLTLALCTMRGPAGLHPPGMTAQRQHTGLGALHLLAPTPSCDMQICFCHLPDLAGHVTAQSWTRALCSGGRYSPCLMRTPECSLWELKGFR